MGKLSAKSMTYVAEERNEFEIPNEGLVREVLPVFLRHQDFMRGKKVFEVEECSFRELVVLFLRNSPFVQEGFAIIIAPDSSIFLPMRFVIILNNAMVSCLPLIFFWT